MKITREEILHLADLSNFTLSESEIEALSTDLGSIVAHISTLNELNTDNVEPTYQVFEMENIWREDEIKEQLASPDQLLNLAPQSIEHQIKVPKVL